METKRKDYTHRTSEIDARILEMNIQGYSSRFIAIQCMVSRSVVRDVLAENNRTAMGLTPVPVEWVSETEIKCSSCGAIKEASRFRHNGRFQHCYSFCNDCFQTRRKYWINGDIERYLAYRIIKTRGETRSKKGCPFTLTRDELFKIYAEQNGLCFYTDREMLTIRNTDNTPNRMSLDRIIPNLGYIPGNVVICTRKANTVKNNLPLSDIREWMPGWYERIKAKFIRDGHEDWLDYEALSE